ncbi:MAG: hypothetical protein J6S85_12555 [Methanobrevibacter sp.]|nr:hypothetical protein [Methanobrevibacter sp.]
MATIIKKGTCASSFRLSSGKVFTFEPDVLKVLNKDEYEALMLEYGYFIKPRIISDKNPCGCFIVSDKITKAGDMDKEVGKVEDKSSQVKAKKTTKGKK